jgi:hypothetical protein
MVLWEQQHIVLAFDMNLDSSLLADWNLAAVWVVKSKEYHENVIE